MSLCLKRSGWLIAFDVRLPARRVAQDVLHYRRRVIQPVGVVPDSMLHRDILLVSRVSGVPAGIGGFDFAGSEAARRVVRWNRVNDRVLLESISFAAVADDSLPISLSVRNNNFPPILASFPIQAFTRDSSSYVIDVTDFFGGDTPAIAGLNAAQRRQYQIRRFDPARSYVSGIRSFPINVEVRQVQTFDAAEPPGDRTGNTISQ